MKNPTKKQVQKVLDNFAKVLPVARSMDRKKTLCSVDMYNGIVEEENICGTPMCHGGWYAVAAIPPRTRKKIWADYTDGARKMAKDLGFKNDDELIQWAFANDDIWGNYNGLNMFSDEIAFNYKGKLTLSKIVAHWKGVQKRLPK